MTARILVKCQIDQIEAIQHALRDMDCRCEVNTDPWKTHRDYYSSKIQENETFKKKEQERTNECNKRRYRDDPGYREHRKAVEKERYQRKKLQQQQQMTQQQSISV